MMKMINKRRVQRIKNLIYAFIILIMFLPLILMSILSFQMFGAIKDLNAKVDNLGKIAASQTAAASSVPESGGGYVIEPDDQASSPADNEKQNAEEPAPETEQSKGNAPESDNPALNNENLTAAANNGSVASDIEGEGTLPPTDGGSELGGGAPVEQSDDGYLAAAGAADGSSGTGASAEASSGTATEKELAAANPQMGYGDAPPVDYTVNPSTGA